VQAVPMTMADVSTQAEQKKKVVSAKMNPTDSTVTLTVAIDGDLTEEELEAASYQLIDDMQHEVLEKPAQPVDEMDAALQEVAKDLADKGLSEDEIQQVQDEIVAEVAIDQAVEEVALEQALTPEETEALKAEIKQEQKAKPTVAEIEEQAIAAAPTADPADIVDQIVEADGPGEITPEGQAAIDDVATAAAVDEVMQELADSGLTEAELAEARLEIEAELAAEEFSPTAEVVAEEAVLEQAVQEIAAEQGMSEEEAEALLEIIEEEEEAKRAAEVVVEAVVEPELSSEEEVAIDVEATEAAVAEVMQELADSGLTDVELIEIESEVRVELEAEAFSPTTVVVAEETALDEAVIEVALEQGLTAEESAALKEQLVVEEEHLQEISDAVDEVAKEAGLTEEEAEALKQELIADEQAS
jgi:hypothetical protein